MRKNAALVLHSKNRVLLVFTVLVVLLCCFIRVRLLAVPLERDEGEFAYMGQLLLKGIPPFTHAYTMKLPGASVMYAFFMALFGQTAVGIRFGLLIVNVVCLFLLYLITKTLFCTRTALYSCASYSLLSISDSVSGLFAHATHFVVLFTLAGSLLLQRSIRKKQSLRIILLGGLCFGLAVTMKQHAAFLVVFAVLYLTWQWWQIDRLDNKKCLWGILIFLFGAVIPYVLTVFWTLFTGSFPVFWFWTIQYAREYAASEPLSHGWSNFIHTFKVNAELQLPFWLMAGFGAVFLCIRNKFCSDKIFVLGLFIFSFLALCPGLIFRDHYFVLLLPSVAMLAGAGFSTVEMLITPSRYIRIAPYVAHLLIVPAIMYSIYQEKNIFLFFTPYQVSRATHGSNPFPEALEIAKYITSNTITSDKIAVLGSEPEIFFYANRLSATGYIYMFGLMEDQPYAQRMQLQMIRDIETTQPNFIVDVNVGASWLATKASDMSIFVWSKGYVQKLYDIVGFVDIGPDSTRYFWDGRVRGYIPVSNSFVTIYKRKNGR